MSDSAKGQQPGSASNGSGFRLSLPGSTRPSTPFGLAAFRSSKSVNSNPSSSSAAASLSRPPTPAANAAQSQKGPIITPRHPGMTVGRKRSRGNDDHSKSGSSSQQDQQLPLVDKPKRSSSKNSKMPPPPPPIFKETTTHFEQGQDTNEGQTHTSKRSRVSAPLSPRQADHVPRNDDNHNHDVNVDSDDHLFDDFEFEMPPSTNDVAAQFEQFKRDSMSVDDHRPSSPGASQTYTDQDVAEHLLRNVRHESIDTDREERERLYSETPFDNQDYRQANAKQYSNAAVQTDPSMTYTNENRQLAVERIYKDSALPYLEQARSLPPQSNEEDAFDTTDESEWLEKIKTAMSRIESVISRSHERATKLGDQLTAHERMLEGRDQQLKAIRKRIADWTDSLDLLQLAASFTRDQDAR